MKIAVLGAGMVGSAMAADLSKKFVVTSIDRSVAVLENVKQKYPQLNIKQHDLGEVDTYDDLLKDFDIVVTAVPGFMGYRTLQAVLAAGKNVVDISFSPEDTMHLDGLAKEKNVTAIVDCGVAPGMSNFIIGYYNEFMHIERFECLVGGLPKLRVKPFEYKAPFSPIDVIEEYTRAARFVENSHIITREALSDIESIDFAQAGTLESFNTDGLRSLIYTMKHIPNMKEKTLRYPGHVSLIQSLIKGGFFSTQKIKHNGVDITPLQFSSAVLFDQWKLGTEEAEFTIMRITLSGTLKTDLSVKKTFIYNLYDEYDPISKTSSMARTTGYTCNAAVELIANKLFNKKGVFPPELVGGETGCFDFVMKYLSDRNVSYTLLES
ncbi:MAG: saccharopine dehydrogenase C-terminal domain-containing protein [Ginsengibacter sp.]